MLFKKILTNDKGIMLCVPNIRVIIHPCQNVALLLIRKLRIRVGISPCYCKY